MLVTKNPGAMAFTVMPYAASSNATLRVRCAQPALAAMYAAPITASVLIAASDVVTMIRPDRCGRRCRVADLIVANTPFRLTSITRFQRSSLYDSIAPSSLRGRSAPAHPLTKPGARVDARVGEGDVEPSVGRDRGVEGGIEAGVIGHVDDLAANVVARAGEASDLGSIAVPSTSRIVTAAPFSASASANANPSPLAPPVTTTP